MLYINTKKQNFHHLFYIRVLEKLSKIRPLKKMNTNERELNNHSVAIQKMYMWENNLHNPIWYSKRPI